MFVGKVIGTVWSTVKWPELQGQKLLLVRPYHLADLANLTDLTDRADFSAPAAVPESGRPLSPAPRGGPDCEAVVCVDLLDAGVGDDVVVAFGHAARVAAQTLDQAAGDRKGPGSSSGPGAPGRKTQEQSNSLGAAPKAPKAAPQAAIVPIDAAVVAIVDSIAVARPST